MDPVKKRKITPFILVAFSFVLFLASGILFSSSLAKDFQKQAPCPPSSPSEQQKDSASVDFTIRVRARSPMIPTERNDANRSNRQPDLEQKLSNDQPSKKMLMPSGMPRKRRLPQALLIGAKKCGTRALLRYLRLHPNIRTPGPEIHYFDQHFEKSLEWYRNQMPDTLKGQLTIEKTPAYLVTPMAPARVYAMNPHTKLIVILRDPVIRAISDYAQSAEKKHHNIRPFEYLALKKNRPRGHRDKSAVMSPSSFGHHGVPDVPHNSSGEINEHWSAIRIGRYASYLENWLEFFPLSQIYFVSGERLITDPGDEIIAVQRFLGLQPVVDSTYFYFNATKGFPCLKKTEGNAEPQCLGASKGRRHPKVAQNVLDQLYDYYKPHNKRLAEMIQMDLGWSKR